MENKCYKEVYPYAWLDEVVEITLNPAKTDVTKLQDQQLDMIQGKFDDELKQVLKQLKADTFYLLSTKKVKAKVTQYYESLILLEQQAMYNLAAYPDGHPLAAAGENIILFIQNTSVVFKKRYSKYILDPVDTRPNPALNPVFSKLSLKLSVDQIGIILKAADDTRLIIAGSLSAIFRAIVPYLATDNLTSISWDSMRKSTYRMEQVDKDLAIAALEKLILKIKSY